MKTKPRYRFKIHYRTFAPGDPVPDTYGEGLIQTMLTLKRIELIPVKQIKGYSNKQLTESSNK